MGDGHGSGGEVRTGVGWDAFLASEPLSADHLL